MPKNDMPQNDIKNQNNKTQNEIEMGYANPQALTPAHRPLEDAKFTLDAACDLLGVSLPTLRRWMEAAGIERRVGKLRKGGYIRQVRYLYASELKKLVARLPKSTQSRIGAVIGAGGEVEHAGEILDGERLKHTIFAMAGLDLRKRAELLKKAIRAWDKALEAKKKKYFSKDGHVTEEREEEDHYAQLEAAEQVAQGVVGMNMKGGRENPESGVVIEIVAPEWARGVGGVIDMEVRGDGEEGDKVALQVRRESEGQDGKGDGV